jgi:glycine/D-amino acid oxidase-like deaminating enzyme
VGGGFAGIAAALSAARMGKRVMLVEKSYYLGGLGTSGLVTIYLPICDGMGRQVSFGIAEELLRLSIEYDCDGKLGVKNWIEREGARAEHSPRYEVNFNPALFATSAEKALLAEEVEILFGVALVSAVTENGKIKYAVVEGKSGRYAIEATSYVDASGDADLADRAGAPTERCGFGNVLSAWYYSHGKDGWNLHMTGDIDVIPGTVPPERASRIRYGGLDDGEISLYMTRSRDRVLSAVLEARKTDETHVPTTIASIPQFRMTRRIAGEYTFTKADDGRYFADSLGLFSNWRERGPVYECPLSTLYSKEVKNLLCAGRCQSADDPMLEISRVIPCCSVMGEAAGVVAALTDDIPAFDVGEAQAVLRARGVPLHESELSEL